jgi:hypothetical protein
VRGGFPQRQNRKQRETADSDYAKGERLLQEIDKRFEWPRI